jgi:hypothetical protein
MAKAFTGERSDEAIALLRQSTDDPYTALDVLFTTAVWTEPALATLNRFASLGRTVYPYRFTRVSPGAKASGDLAKHTSEIRYVFGNLAPPENYDAVDARLSRDMQEAWTTFARNGIPELRGQTWPSYKPNRSNLTVLGDEVTYEPLDVAPLTSLIAPRTPKSALSRESGPRPASTPLDPPGASRASRVAPEDSARARPAGRTDQDRHGRRRIRPEGRAEGTHRRSYKGQARQRPKGPRAQAGRQAGRYWEDHRGASCATVYRHLSLASDELV